MDKWTGILIGKMHNARVSYDEMAAEIGCSKAYISMVLNCKKKPANARERFNRAFTAIIDRRKE